MAHKRRHQRGLDESKFAKINKEMEAYAELIRSKEDEKRDIIDDFNKERKRLKSGKISRKTLASSAKRVRRELSLLDNEMSKDIRNLDKLADRAKVLADKQTPKKYNVSVKGAKLAVVRRKHRAHANHKASHPRKHHRAAKKAKKK
jgi:hypothetical protein